MMRSLFILVAGAALAAAGSARAYACIRSPRRQVAYLACALVFAGAAISTNASIIYVVTDRATGIDNSAGLGSHLLVLCGLWAGVEMVASIAGSTSRCAWWVRLLGITMLGLVLVGLFARARPHPSEPEFYDAFRTDVDLLPYWLALLLGMSVCLTYIAFLTLSSSRYAASDWLKWGLGLTGFGAAFMTAFLLCQVLTLFTSVWLLIEALPLVLLACGALCLSIGASLPSAGASIQRRRHRRELAPLWQAMTALHPVVRDRPSQPGLYRTVVEILDAAAMARTSGQADNPTVRTLTGIGSRTDLSVAELATELRALSVNLPPHAVTS
jgi:hypothetical protein